MNPPNGFLNQYVGFYGRGTFSQSAGINSESDVFLGYHTGSSGTYELIGGSISTWNSQYVGHAGTGTFSQSGGTNTVGGSLYLGYTSGAKGTYNLSGGSLTATGPIVLASASSSTGELKVAKAAYVEVGGLTINSGGGRSTKVSLELDANGPSLIRTMGAATLAARWRSIGVSSGPARATSSR